MKTFKDMGLSPALNATLASMQYKKPTPIQAEAIPYALKGHDVMGTAQTGTGKTAAFAIPLVEFLLNNPDKTAIVLSPTRELGKQIMGIMAQLLGRKSHIKSAFIIGGEAMNKQFRQLKDNPRLIVGTPGRINDHLSRGSLNLKKAEFLVLDETDRMLDMGFTSQIEKILKHMPNERQTLMFSATLPKGILKLSENYMKNPKRVAIGQTNEVAKNIQQDVIRIEQGHKYKELTSQLHDRNGSVIVFVKTKRGADRMAKNLKRDGFKSDALHGDLKQNKRERVMRNFRDSNFRVLIATDVAARGLDVPHIKHVINYDLPQVAEDFIHRLGRTARAGEKGSALSFVSNQDGRKWHAIERLLNPDAKPSSDKPKQKKQGKGKPHFKKGKKRPEHGKKPKFNGKKRRFYRGKKGAGKKSAANG